MLIPQIKILLSFNPQHLSSDKKILFHTTPSQIS